MKVERIKTERGSHVEPPLDEDWPDIEKLEWLAAVVECDSGLRLVPEDRDLPSHRRFVVLAFGGGVSFGSHYFTFEGAWSYMTHLGRGAEILRAQQADG